MSLKVSERSGHGRRRKETKGSENEATETKGKDAGQWRPNKAGAAGPLHLATRRSPVSDGGSILKTVVRGPTALAWAMEMICSLETAKREGVG